MVFLPEWSRSLSRRGEEGHGQSKYVAIIKPADDPPSIIVPSVCLYTQQTLCKCFRHSFRWSLWVSSQLWSCMENATISISFWWSLYISLCFRHKQIPTMKPLTCELHIKHPLQGDVSQPPHWYWLKVSCDLDWESHMGNVFQLKSHFSELVLRFKIFRMISLVRVSPLHKSFFHGLNQFPSFDNCVQNIFSLEYLFLN